MANGTGLRRLCRARIITVKTLMAADDWDAAAYMMGYVLETALKAAPCKALKLTNYPERTSNKQIDSCFMSHKFDQLLIISGLADLFSITGSPNSFRNWSDFVQEYQGEWVNMRYNPQALQNFDKIKVERLSQNLFDDPESIIKTISGKNRW
jgi:hypothetical protein